MALSKTLKYLPVIAVTLFVTSAFADDACDQTSASQLECLTQVAARATTQLKKDWIYLTKLAKSRNPDSIRLLTMGNLAFRNYVFKNCESEGHDAFGGTLQDVLEQKCRRDTLLSRHRLFERIGEPHPLGRKSEEVFGRPICDAFHDESKPMEIGTMVRLQDTDDLRKKLDEIALHAASSGHYTAEVSTLLRKVHQQAESLRRQDASYTCLGILEGFCPGLDKTKTESAEVVRNAWLSRCQTEILSSFYKRASTRLRNLKEQDSDGK